jgi:hypothetical protein
MISTLNGATTAVTRNPGQSEVEYQLVFTFTRPLPSTMSGYPSAAASLLEGPEECFTINRLGLPPTLRRCLATTNIIESPDAGVRI